MNIPQISRNGFTNLAAMKDIPVHQIQDRVSSGFEIWHFLPNEIRKSKADNLGAHRDDHYIFFVLETGVARLMIDFHELPLRDHSLYYILPGQVHHRINADIASGWFIAADTSLIPPDYRDVFENQLVLQQPVQLPDNLFRQCNTLLSLADEKGHENDRDTFKLPIIYALLKSFFGIAAECYNTESPSNKNLSRPAQISREFKKLLVQNVHTVKSPSEYASKLNVSEPYLNEVLKKVTGFSVSSWIQQEVVLEAKRLLYYSDLNVKEITHRLGYDDPAYFSRVFTNTAGSTPLAFRKSYRK